MKGIAFTFIMTGAVAVTIGMAWGIQMSASGDHTLSPAHGHLNLIGWVTMSIWGIYYALTPAAAESPLARGHYLLSLAAVIILVPGIVMAITERGETLAQIGSLLILGSVLLFLWILTKFGVGRSGA